MDLVAGLFDSYGRPANIANQKGADLEPNLDVLIRRLNDTKPLSDVESSALYRTHTDAMIERAMALADEISASQSGFSDFLQSEKRDLSILNQSEDAFRAALKAIDTDLDRQIEIVNEGLDTWFEIGLIVPPYYAWRIVIILAKEKRSEYEKAFLAAWCRHFGQMKGARFEALADRARKRGLIV